MWNEAYLLDIEGILDRSTSDVFQNNFRDVVQEYVHEKLEQSDVGEINALFVCVFCFV